MNDTPAESGSPAQTDWDAAGFYTKYYEAVKDSRANATYCERLFGKDFGQHGFAEVRHLDALMEVVGLEKGMTTLDLGCGNGGISEYLSDRTGANFVGIDFIPEAIAQAVERTASKRDRLQFRVMDMSLLDFADGSFDVILAVDTLYFTPLNETLTNLLRLLKPGGRMGVFWSVGADPQVPLKIFDKTTCHPDRTELAVALQNRGLDYRTWNYSQADYEHAQRKQKIAEELKAQFEAEGNLFLYENHVGEAKGVQEAYEAGAHARYLYRIENGEKILTGYAG